MKVSKLVFNSLSQKGISCNIISSTGRVTPREPKASRNSGARGPIRQNYATRLCYRTLGPTLRLITFYRGVYQL